MKLRSAFLCVLCVLGGSIARADEAPPPPGNQPGYVVWLPSAERVRFRNPDGSCVQCSIGMAGVAANVPAAEMLLWDSPYGPRVRGASSPERVRNYCNARQIAAYNVFGPDAWPWLCWALETGRPAGITWGTMHMITAVGATTNAAGKIDQQSYIAVCDNNSPQKISWYSVPQFRRSFEAFGGSGWVVILRTPPPAGLAAYCAWWE